jgi:hypothetical protein
MCRVKRRNNSSVQLQSNFQVPIMQKFLLLLIPIAFLCIGGIPDQGVEAAGKDTPALAGQWTYRSYRNAPDLVNGDASKALALIFGEGVFTFETPSEQTLKGTLDMGGGYVLDLDGKVERDTQTSSVTIKVIGLGRAGTSTDGWEYDYQAGLAYEWPAGVNQVAAFVGSVIRAKPHNGAPAGYVASFIAVKHP